MALKSIEEVAREVVRGNWGNGAIRKKNLEAAGYNYDVVQAEVNRIMAGYGTAPGGTVNATIDKVAREVITGQWGNGAERKARLEAAGYNYQAVQNHVNKLCGK